MKGGIVGRHINMPAALAVDVLGVQVCLCVLNMLHLDDSVYVAGLA